MEVGGPEVQPRGLPPLCPPALVHLAMPVVGEFPSLKDGLGHELQHSHLIDLNSGRSSIK